MFSGAKSRKLQAHSGSSALFEECRGHSGRFEVIWKSAFGLGTETKVWWQMESWDSDGSKRKARAGPLRATPGLDGMWLIRSQLDAAGLHVAITQRPFSNPPCTEGSQQLPSAHSGPALASHSLTAADREHCYRRGTEPREVK